MKRVDQLCVRARQAHSSLHSSVQFGGQGAGSQMRVSSMIGGWVARHRQQSRQCANRFFCSRGSGLLEQECAEFYQSILRNVRKPPYSLKRSHSPGGFSAPAPKIQKKLDKFVLIPFKLVSFVKASTKPDTVH